MERPPSLGRYPARRRDTDPRLHDPNANLAGPNVPPVSVGPTSSTNSPDTFVMQPAEPWSGWPDPTTPGADGTIWTTPLMDPYGAIDHGGGTYSGYGYGRGDVWNRVSTAMTCVDLNSRQLGSFPVYGMKGSSPFQLPPWSENPEPEAYSSWTEFVQSAVNSLLLRGECILYVTGRFADGYPSRFVTLNPDLVTVDLVDGRRVVTLSGGTDLDPRDVNVIRYQSWPQRLRGVSPLEWISRSIVTSSALERYATGLATRGGIPWGILKAAGNISKEQAEQAQTRWISARARADGAPAVIGGGLDLTPLTISPKDMALLELREFDERRICAAFGVPAYLVNVEQAGGMTYANASDLRTQHWQTTLRVLANLLATGWSSFLLPRGSRLEFNPDRYVQPPFGERVGGYATMFGLQDPETGLRAMEVTEIRAAERMMPVPQDPTADPLNYAQRLTGATT